MSNKIFVANFPFRVTQDDLHELFEPFGEVVSAKVATDRETGRSRGFGFVEMQTAEQASEAIEKLNGHEMDGRPLAVRVAEDRRGPGGPPGGGRGGPRRGPGGGGRFGGGRDGGGYGGGGQRGGGNRY